MARARIIDWGTTARRKATDPALLIDAFTREAQILAE